MVDAVSEWGAADRPEHGARCNTWRRERCASTNAKQRVAASRAEPPHDMAANGVTGNPGNVGFARLGKRFQFSDLKAAVTLPGKKFIFRTS